MKFFRTHFICSRGMPMEEIRTLANNHAKEQGWAAWYWWHNATPAVAPTALTAGNSALLSTVDVLYRTALDVPSAPEVIKESGLVGLQAHFANPGECWYDCRDVFIPAVVFASSPDVVCVLPGCEQPTAEEIRTMLSPPTDKVRLTTVPLFDCSACWLWGVSNEDGIFDEIAKEKTLLLLSIRLPDAKVEDAVKVLRCNQEKENKDDDTRTFGLYAVGGDRVGFEKFCGDGIRKVFRGDCEAFQVAVIGVTDGVTTVPDFPAWLKAKGKE